MKRLALSALLIAALTAGLLATTGARHDPDEDPRYWVTMDNAFGLIEGADVKVAGVRAGQIESFRIEPETYRALVEIRIGKKGFGELRKDVHCESRPQSLIGEYFLDCLPGTAKEKFPVGGTIPVEQTGSTIPPDLITNIMRRPFRERFSIIISEFGAALAGRGEDLNETIRRANPALRETNKVLAQLREERRVIRDLADDAENVVVALARKKNDVGRFIEEARDTSAASAQRAEDIEKQFQRFPVFLRELRPTMRLLGEASERQRSALANLSSQATLLERFLNDLGPFSEASRPAFRTLAELATAGRSAVRVTRPRVRELGAFAKNLPELVTNLAITLEHLHDRDFATEKDPRSPGGEGFTGFEAILNYVFRQSQATNVYDGNSYMLKVSAFLDNNCAQYAVAETAKREDRQYCRAILGKNNPGIDVPDPSAEGKEPVERKKARRKRGRDRDRDGGRAPANGQGGTETDPGGGERPILPDLLQGPNNPLNELLPPSGPVPGVDARLPLLDFLLGS